MLILLLILFFLLLSDDSDLFLILELVKMSSVNVSGKGGFKAWSPPSAHSFICHLEDLQIFMKRELASKEEIY